MSSFTEQGFILIKNAISIELITTIKSEMAFILNKKNKISNIDKFLINFFINEKLNFYDELFPVFNYLLYRGLLEKLLLSTKLYSSFIDILGKDLAFCCDPSLTVNIPNKSSSEENYLYKDWHQEIWSGASHTSIQIWTPLFQKESKNGQMEIIPGSHLWGHIPHQNRRPIQLPSNLNIEKTNLEIGDVLIFSSLLLHRSIPTNYTRISLPMLIKNIRFENNSFEKLRNFKIFSTSEITNIERKLGNHNLSSFRLEQSKLENPN